jgi:Actinobacteria/chloroflexi VLRF1 release factor
MPRDLEPAHDHPPTQVPPRPSRPYGLCVRQTRYIGRANLRKRLAPLEGVVGRTCYCDGSARLELAGGTLTVTPPFGLGHEGEYEQVVVGPLLEALGEDHTVAALLVRLGGYALGVFEGERLADSKVGSRFVKGRHRAGGSSASRFRRRREGQERELIAEAAAEAARVLAPWQGKVERVALGGDRGATRRVLAARPDLAWLEPLALERYFAVPEPRQRVLDELPYRLYAAKVVNT